MNKEIFADFMDTLEMSDEEMEECVTKNNLLQPPKNTNENTEEKIDQVKTLIKNFRENNNIFLKNNETIENFYIMLEKFKSIELNLRDCKNISNLIDHLDNWNFQIKSENKSPIKFNKFKTFELEQIFKTKLYNNFGDFSLVLNNVKNFSNLLEINKSLNLKNIEIFNQIQIFQILIFLEKQTLTHKMNELLFYVGTRLNNHSETTLFLKIYKKNNIPLKLINKISPFIKKNKKNMIQKIFQKKGEEK
jgi:hypothetical protein